MAKQYTDDQLAKYAAQIVAGLKGVQFTPEQIAGVLAWGLGNVYLDSANGLTKTQYLANVVITVDKCIEAGGGVPKGEPKPPGLIIKVGRGD
jgi:hypothetical protein